MLSTVRRERRSMHRRRKRKDKRLGCVMRGVIVLRNGVLGGPVSPGEVLRRSARGQRQSRGWARRSAVRRESPPQLKLIFTVLIPS